MKRNTRIALTGGVLAAFLLSSGLVAQALWSAATTTGTPSFAVGSVNFGAHVGADVSERTVSEGGEAVSVVLPGAKIIEVLEQTPANPDPVIWRFTASGTALGITGINYDVSATEQRTEDDTYNLASGYAKPGTVLEGSTLKIYPAAAGGDCSAVPATPEPAEGEDPRNVYLFGNTDVELQAAGAATDGSVSEQEWCASLNWNHAADGLYRNSVQVTGIAEDGSVSSGIDTWHAAVGYPPSLALLGTYRNRGFVEATAEDTSKVRAQADWHADVYPDPAGEPDVVITLDPIITNLNPDVDPRD